MEVHLLGTAGYHPNEDRHTACLMIPEAGVVLDAGTGFFRVRDLIQTRNLHIFLSHCHLDHCFGLSFFIDVLHQKNVEDVFVYGHAEKLQAIRDHLFSEYLFPLKPDFHWTAIDPQDGATGRDVPLGGKVTWFPLTHPGGSLGFRLDWPDSNMAYITDTTAAADADYISFIRETGLLIHECHFPDGFEAMAKTTGHSCLTPVAQVCAAAAVNQCVIVHLNPLSDGDASADLASVKPIFENISIGHDRTVLTF